ncbi:16S rRNA (cytosine(1402)-N(4))-methyltransferase RsmH [Corynebacterium uterequi]|uniref:Ribosomal RNA small subunit methyltransferase H n=1 Tax=Corynebacterium uterequi TaxID=1072256 RepID=A0A0G3HDL9_9CORY|nr:16S rRNA (cytosine(1402)-N(4))-methyltransferase RsmH [Corynebacterium uterequi]AKK11466.1 16S rRNA (cytosine(1402)-N(4))-methyltransferase [Corynebacterium uterequi]
MAHSTDTHLTDHHGHVPVLRDRVTELLAPAITSAGDDAVVVDGTLGAGGHTEHLLRTFGNLKVIGIDRDQASLANATKRLAPFAERFIGVYARFDDLVTAVDTLDHPVAGLARRAGIAGALYDLGVSSMQLDQLDRGFAYRADAPLDMRMDPTQGPTAADVLNTYSHGDLARILKTYGEERFAGKIASAIVAERRKEPFSTSHRLVELLYATIPAATRRTGGHPAKRTFQALRVEVNRELESVEASIPAITSRLRVGGRAVYMSYQSLEDKIVKSAFKELTTSTTPPGLPMDLPGTAPAFRLVTRGAERASEAEIEQNPRANPVRVRVIERIATNEEN